jgi:hypothetical protein
MAQTVYKQQQLQVTATNRMRWSTVQLKCDGTRWRTEGETGEWKWVASTLHTTSEHGVYSALLPLMRTPRLPVVDWTDAPADLNGTRPFRRKTKPCFCACAITFQTQSTPNEIRISSSSSSSLTSPPPGTENHGRTSHLTRTRKLKFISVI